MNGFATQSLMGEGEALHHVGCRTKALNLIWFRGGGDLRYNFTASGGEGEGGKILQFGPKLIPLIGQRF
jgi:hypothetical protein